MIVDKITGCRFVVFDVIVIPGKGLVVKPSTIKPIAKLMTSATSPFLKRFSNRPGSMG